MMSETGAAGAAQDNPMAARHTPAVGGDADVAAIEEALRDVIDPELGINVVDLGLLYGASIEPDGTIVLDMTLTTAACPLTDVIEEQAQQALGLIADKVRIQWSVAAVGPGQDHPGGTRAAARPGLQRLRPLREPCRPASGAVSACASVGSGARAAALWTGRGLDRSRDGSPLLRVRRSSVTTPSARNRLVTGRAGTASLRFTAQR